MHSNRYMTDDEVWLALNEHDELAYSDIPSWLRNELVARRISFEIRSPTEQEQIETEIDAKYHRVTHNEMNINDYKDKYHV